MRRNRRHVRAFSLLLTVVLIGAIGVTLGLLCRHFAGLSCSVNQISLDARAAQLLADGRAWAAAHPDRCAAIAGGETIDLPVGDAMPAGMVGSLRLSAEVTSAGASSGSQDVRDLAQRQVVITAIVRQGKLASTSRATVPIRTRPSDGASSRIDPPLDGQ